MRHLGFSYFFVRISIFGSERCFSCSVFMHFQFRLQNLFWGSRYLVLSFENSVLMWFLFPQNKSPFLSKGVDINFSTQFGLLLFLLFSMFIIVSFSPLSGVADREWDYSHIASDMGTQRFFAWYGTFFSTHLKLIFNLFR